MGIPVKGYNTHNHFIKSNADGVDIASLIHKAASGLLRWNVMNRTHAVFGSLNRGSKYGLGNTEIWQLNCPVPGYEYIHGLDIPVNHMLGMGRFNCL